MKMVMEREFELIWVGNEITTNLSPDLQLADKDYEKGIWRITDLLKEVGAIFRV